MMSVLDNRHHPTTRRTRRTVTILAACWSLPYIGSKIQHAAQGRLGVHGGPVVTADDAAQYGGAVQISSAQWGNAGIGVLILLATVMPLLPGVRRWNWWARTLPLLLGTTLLLGMAILFLLRVLAGDGGLPFTLYLFAWTALLAVTILANPLRTAGARTAAGCPQRRSAGTTP